ncbi:MAG: diaminopimelate epimerase [Gammaproteobacteria bacterium]
MAITVKFMKMHALGNDFVIIDSITQNVRLSEAQVREIANRNTGVGCDQILLIEPPHVSEIDFFCRIYNADGHEVFQCGNGLRCVGRFIKEMGLSTQKTISVATEKNVNHIEILDHPQVRVNLGVPNYAEQNPVSLSFLDQNKHAHLVDLGNPHCIFFMSQLDSSLLKSWGEALQNHPKFPNGVNVSLVECLAKNHIKAITYERGAGETMACGSAACAAVVAGISSRQLGAEVRVDMPGGHLQVSWPDKTKGILLSGSTNCVFLGQLALNHFSS